MVAMVMSMAIKVMVIMLVMVVMVVMAVILVVVVMVVRSGGTGQDRTGQFNFRNLN